MAVCPTNFDERVECPFVDRKEFIEAFENAFHNISQKDYSVLVYYGVAGIGKTTLRKELPALLEKHNESDRHMRVIWTSIDFATEQYRQPYKFLEVLSSQLHQKYDIKFNFFDIALATYWKKVNPYVPLIKENYSKESIVCDVLDICDEFVPANLIPKVFNLAKSLPERYQKWVLKRKDEISRLPDLEPAEIDEQLPVYWAYDLADHLQNTSESAVIFIDAYEALWEKEREIGSFNSKDKWIRKVIENIQKSCLWIICGRESLRWEEVDEDWKKYLNQLKMEKLPDEDSINLLEQCAIPEKDIQKVLIEGSEGVPYYLELSIDTYRKIKKRKQPSPEDFSKVPDGIFCRFVKYLDREEKETLKILSAPRYWDRELFEILIEKFNTGYPSTSFSELHGFSFMNVDDKGKCTMHQLIRKSLQEYQDQELKKKAHSFMLNFYSNLLKDLDIKAITPEHESALTEAFYHAKELLEAKELFKWFIATSDQFERAAFWQLITPLYEEMLQLLETKLGSEHLSVATTLNNLAELYRQTGDYEKALPLCKRALEIREKRLEPQHLSVATTLNNLAILYIHVGNYEKALPLLQRALEIAEETLGPQHPNVATTLNNLTEIHRQMGDYGRALPLCKKALEIAEETLGPQHPNVATTLNSLALLYCQMGDCEKALPLYNRALEIYEKELNSQHPDVATTLNNLAELHRQMGDYEKALPLYNRALEITEKTLGPQHPDVATTLNNLAILFRQIGDYEKALPLCKRALEIVEETLGPQHPNVAKTLNNLAELHRQMGDYGRALPLYNRALEIYEKGLGLQHSDVAQTLNNLAVLYRQMGDYEKALPLYNRALKIREKGLGLQHPDVAQTLNNLAALYDNMGDYEKALPLYERSLEIREKRLGSQHPSIATTLNNLAVLYIHIGNYEKALPLLQRALEITEKTLGSQHPDVAQTLNNLAALYIHIGNYEKALSLLQRALEIREKVLGPQHSDVATSLNNLAVLYRQMGDYEKALALHNRALEIREKVLGKTIQML